MRRSNYFFNEKTCSYEPVPFSFARVIANTIGILLLTFLSGVLVFSLYNKYFESPVEMQLREENKSLKKNYILIQTEMKRVQGVLAELQEQDEMIYRTILEASPLKKSSKVNYISSNSDDLLVQDTFDKINNIKAKIATQTESYREILKLSQKREHYLASLPAIQPISNRNLKRIADGFGMRFHPIHKIHKMHSGIDYVAPRGTPIYATGNGVIKSAKYSAGYGNMIEVDHGYGTVTRYGHMHAFNNIQVGQKVIRGQCIGYVGSTGTSTGPHVHYEIIRNKSQINPTTFFFGELNAAQYDAVLEVASRKTRSAA